MPLTLDNPDVINGTVTDEHIKSFTIDDNGGFIYIVYDRKASDGTVVVPDVTHTLFGAEMEACIARAEELKATETLYNSIKQALYEYLPSNGTVS